MTSHDDLVKRSLRLLTYHRRRIWWIVSRVVVLTVAITALALALSPKYVARTKMTLLPTRSELGFASVRPEMWGLSPAALLAQTHEEALQSRTLAEDVARSLQAENAADMNTGGVAGLLDRWFVSPLLGSFHRIVTLLNTGRWETPDPFRSLVDRIQRHTEVQILPSSFVFQVGVTWKDPKMAAKIANLLTERYVQMTLRTGQEEMRTTREYIDARIKETGSELEALEKKIEDYRMGEKIYAASTDLDLGLQELSQYLRDLNATRVNWEQLDSRITALKPYQTPAALAAIEAERTGLKTRQASVEKVIGEQIAKLDKLPAKEAGLLDLYRVRMSKERALTALQDRLLDTKVAEAAQLSTVRVIDPAIPPIYPERPLLLRNAAAAVLVGLLLSVGFVLLVEARRAGLRCREDLAAEAPALLGLMPYVAADSHDDPDAEKAGRMAEFFRDIAHGRYGTVAHRRTAKRHVEQLFVRLADRGIARVCLFVSLNGREGKTFLIEQLAKVTREAGRRVLLVDANLNHPALHEKFGKPLAAGLAEMLTSGAAAKDVLIPIDESTDLICAGLAHINGQSYWDLLACKEQLKNLSAEYDLVLIDSAALRQFPAASRLPILSDRTVCVFDATKSTQDDPASAREHLHLSAVAVQHILNKVQYAADYLFGAGEAQDRAQEAQGGVSAKSPVTARRERPLAVDADDSRRQFARHRTTLPVVCRANGRVNGDEQVLRNISYGGLSFVGMRRHAPGEILTIEFPFHDVPVELKGGVKWSQLMPDSDGTLYAHGVEFAEHPESVLASVVDQVRQVEELRDLERRRTGRELSDREAVEEWRRARGSNPAG